MGPLLLATIGTFGWLVAADDSLIDGNSTLRFVHVIWRHGDRSPSKGTFPTDTKNGESTWPQGWGELSHEGIQQQYALGSYLRQRYVDSGFLSDDYNAKEIYVRSTSYNRTIMSAFANLAGMYPAPKDRTWSDNITWQPIPVHSVPKEMDPLLWTDLPCPRAYAIYHDEILKSKEVRRIEEDNNKFFSFLRNKTGLSVVNLDDIWTIFDPLKCERLHNDHEVPSWVTDDVFDQISVLNDVGTTFYFHDFRLQRLRGGMLFGEIGNRMEAKAKNSSILQPSALKYYAYSAHDTTLLALLENLGVYDGHAPKYAAAVIFELHETALGDFIVKVLHINTTGSRSPVPLVMKGCGATDASAQCTLDAFVKMAREHTPTDWYAECGIVPAASGRDQRMTIAAIMLGVVATVLLMVVLFLTRKLRRESRPKW